MSKEENSKPYGLEDRTFQFARQVRALVRKVPRTLANIEDCRQPIRASGSMGANYREANEAVSKKDFAFRIKISRKESKESRYWLRLLHTGDGNDLDGERNALAQEARELMNIFGAIVRKTQ